jgi:hypothetical protein
MVCICTLFLLACNDDKTIPLSSDLVDPSQLGQRQQSTKTIVTDSTANKIANTFGTLNLWLGKFDDMENQVLIRFAKLNLPDTVTIVAGTLKLHSRLVQGTGAGFEATIHEVKNSWDSLTVTYQNDIFQKDFFNTVPMDIQRVESATTDSIIFKLDLAVVSSWRTKDGREKGVLIQAPDASFTKAFHSHFSTPKQPVLELITLTKGNTKNDTARYSAVASVFVFHRLVELRKGPLYVGLGEQHQSSLFFDVSAIPRNATISRALLTLEVDTLNSTFYSNRLDLQLSQAINNFNLDPLRFQPFTSYPDSLIITDIDSVNSSMNKITFLVTTPVQRWVLDSGENFGVILFPITFTGRDLTRAAFYSRETDATRAPKLEIEYTLPPQ